MCPVEPTDEEIMTGIKESISAAQTQEELSPIGQFLYKDFTNLMKNKYPDEVKLIWDMYKVRREQINKQKLICNFLKIQEKQKVA